MGCGASTRKNRVAVATEPADAGCSKGGMYNNTTLDVTTLMQRQCERLEEEVLWLRKLFDKEKAEKQWLMTRHEQVEQEVLLLRGQARDQEMAGARSRPSSIASLPTPSVQSSTSAPGFPAMAAAAATTGTPPTSAASGGGGSGLPTSPTTSSSLKDRRGLRLSVVTAKPADDVANASSGGGGSGAPTMAAAEKKVAQPEAALPEPPHAANDTTTALPPPKAEERVLRPSKRELFFHSLEVSDSTDGNSRPIEPMTAKACMVGVWGSNSSHIEPMSPLLRRRRSDRFRPESGEALDKDRLENRNLNVQATKFRTMPELVPVSPKRIPPSQNRLQGNNWCAQIKQTESEDDSPKVSAAT